MCWGSGYYVSEEAAREAVAHQSSFNAIHETTLIKVDFMVRKREDYRLHEFTRRLRLQLADFELWVVSKEDLILSKLDWARESTPNVSSQMWKTSLPQAVIRST